MAHTFLADDVQATGATEHRTTARNAPSAFQHILTALKQLPQALLIEEPPKPRYHFIHPDLFRLGLHCDEISRGNLRPIAGD